MQALPVPAVPQDPLLYYLDLGINVLPLAHGQKEPYTSVLPDNRWKMYQQRKASADEVRAWCTLAPAHGVGLICGRISGGLVCIDCDEVGFAAWVLDNKTHILLRGTWVVETGSGKAHVWVRTTDPPQVHAWYLSQGHKAGEVRGEGSYAAAPPSLHPSGQVYLTVAGSPEHIAFVDDADALAQALVETYLGENPGSAPPPTEATSKRFLQLDSEQIAEAASRVVAAGFTRKIRDTLLKDDNHTPGDGYWRTAPSHSEIDFAVACEMVRKGWSMDDAEWCFAGSKAAPYCYADASRHGSRGRAYWVHTWTKAQASVSTQQAAARVAAGGNFKVLQALQLGHADPRYRLKLETMGASGGERQFDVTLTTEELTSDRRFQSACIRQVGWQPRFTNGQRGRDFEQFTDAVLAMISDKVSLPDEFSTTGHREAVIGQQLRLCGPNIPQQVGEVSLGWQQDGDYFVMGVDLYHALRAQDRHCTNEQFMDTLHAMALVQPVTHCFEDGTQTRVLRLRLKQPLLGRVPLPPGGGAFGS